TRRHVDVRSKQFRYVPTYSPTAGRFHGLVPRQPTRACARSMGRSTGLATLHPLPGDNSCVEPPDPIPNSEVKRVRADGSVHLACESRSLPGSLPRNPAALAAGFLFVPGLLGLLL